MNFEHHHNELRCSYSTIKTIYNIAAKLWNEQPEEVTAQILRQGSNIEVDDYFGVILDPFHDRRSGYLFQVNPNGVRADAIYENTTQTQANWEGIWEAGASVVEDGWVVEMAIPFKTLSFDPSKEAWGINFTRRLARNNETIGWLSRTQAQNPGVAGVANGFYGLEQGRGLDIVPSVSAGASRDFAINRTDNNSEPSLDIFYKFTPAVTGVLTLNTDFSATEVDDRQVNLTRFSLFFPEKRDFFLQDADIFEFGGIEGGNNLRIATQNGRPFFSRNIGLSASREPVEPDVGAKLTGRVGDWNFGVLSVQQDEFEDVDATNLFVGRAVRNVLEESRVGFIMTDGDPQSNGDNSLAGFDFRYLNSTGFDFRYLNSRLPGGRTLDGDAWYQRSHTPGPEGAFATRLTQLTTEVVFSSALSWVNLIQWDNDSDILGINSRLHWAPQSGRDFYLVLNHSLQDLDEDGTFSSLGADLTAKASYTFRF